MASTGRHVRLEAVAADASVTRLELFFDLVFVFGLTQVTALLAEDLTAHGLIRGLLILGLIWWSWVGYAWLGNVVRADEGSARLAMLSAMAAMFLLALSIPEAFDDLPGGLPGPMVVPLCYFAFRALHLALFWIVGDEDPGLRRQLVRFAPSMLSATAILLVASQVEGRGQTALWALALAADYVGTFLGGASGWRLRSAGHFAERHGLILIVALGESIVAIGVGVTELPISWPIAAAAVLGLALAAMLWQLYFDMTSLKAERAMAALEGEPQTRLARDAYSYLHLPMMAGIVLVALGLKKVLEYVGDEEAHGLSDALGGLGIQALYGGVALYLLAQVAFERRTLGRFHGARLAVAGLVVLLLPLAAWLPALAALALLATVSLALVGSESWRYGEYRYSLHHDGHGS